MLKDLQKYSYFGNKSDLSLIFFEFTSNSSIRKIESLRQLCIDKSFKISVSFYAILELLNYLEIIEINLDTINSKINNSKYSKADILILELLFFKLFFKKLIIDNTLDKVFNSSNIKLIDKKYFVNTNYINQKNSFIKKILIGNEFILTEFKIGNYSLINPIYNSIFFSIVIDYLNKKNLKRIFTLEKLKEINELKSKLGDEAELFVLDFEIKRLKMITNDKIKIISNTHVNAGFDIISFDTNHSVVYDRFIEVKSFSDVLKFYWSENEMHVAKELSTNYYLYLVDRTKINNIDYVPIVIQDPINNIRNNENWLCKIESYSFELKLN